MNPSGISLAGRAAELSTSLYSLGERCGHDQTSNDISNIGGELALLSTTRWRLHEAMAFNSGAYTTAFNADLNEITSELTLLFDEIGECCAEMQKKDTPGAAGRFFKKGRVSKLQKHLEALKTTLAVMRTVLHHGKDYGIQNSPGRLAESAPHTMSEDRAILESVFAKNRNAIMDLHHLENSHQHSSSASSGANTGESSGNVGDDTSSKPDSFSPGAHGRNLSAATGVEVPPIPDVLPSKPGAASKLPSDTLSRRFSKRRVRLGVHMSILDLGAHEVAAGLRKKWITQTRAPAYVQAPMSTISEHSMHPKFKQDSETTTGGMEHASELKMPARTDSDESVSKSRRRANSLIGSPVGKAISRIIRRLSLTSVRGGRHVHNDGSGTTSADSEEVGNDSGGSLKKKLSLHITKPELKTPDFNQEIENGRW